MRYYNENPQVTLWREKYRKEIADYNELVSQHNELVSQYNENVDDYNELEDEVEHFNSLPWYKKMFYKFKI